MDTIDSIDSVLDRLDASMKRLADRESPDPSARGGSRFVGDGADPVLVDHVAGGGSYAVDRRSFRKRIADGDRYRTEPQPRGLGGTSKGLDLLRDVRAVRRGDFGAFERVRRTAKAVTGGELLVPEETLDGYIEARRAAGPVRPLCSEFGVTAREVRMLLEGDELAVDWTPEGGLKPSSDASVVEKIALVFKAAGVTVVPDELLDDSNGLAEQIVARSFGTAIGKKIDRALVDGTGVGQPTGVLRAAGVNHVTVAGQGALTIFDSVAGAIARLRAKFYEPTAIVMRPEVALRFEIARSASTEERLFPGGVEDAFGTRVVYDANLPVDGTGLSSIIVADWRLLYVLSRQGLAIESSPYPAFESDETTFRAHERIGAAVTKPEAFEVIDGVDITP